MDKERLSDTSFKIFLISLCRSRHHPGGPGRMSGPGYWLYPAALSLESDLGAERQMGAGGTQNCVKYFCFYLNVFIEWFTFYKDNHNHKQKENK